MMTTKTIVAAAVLLALLPNAAQAEDANTDQMCITLRSMIAARTKNFADYTGKKISKDRWSATVTMPFATACYVRKGYSGYAYICDWSVNGDGVAPYNQFTTNIDACTSATHEDGKSVVMRSWKVNGANVSLFLDKMFNQPTVSLWVETQ